MRGAAAALAGAVLFFLGVLSAAPDGNRVAPPPAIPLGVSPAASTDAGQTPEAGTAPASPATPPDPNPPEVTGPGGPSASAGEEPPPGGSGGVEEVTGQVDCLEVGERAGRGDGSCPPGQAKKIGDPPRDRNGDGDGQPN